MAPIAIFVKSRTCFRLKNFKSISTFVHLHQEAELAEPHDATPLPPNPATGNPRYNENWRSPLPASSAGDGALVPVGLGGFHNMYGSPLQTLSQSIDAESIMNLFASWMTMQRWDDVMKHFEVWIKSLDKNGKLNKPDVNLYNQYLRANLMTGVTSSQLLDVLTQMEDFLIVPNTASYNMVLKAMHRDSETVAAAKLIDRMLEIGKEHKESLPDHESYDHVIDMHISRGNIDVALKYIDLALKSGCMLSLKAFVDCVRYCVRKSKLDTAVLIIERCKKIDQNKSLSLPWRLCGHMAEVAMQSDHSELTFYALEFMAKWIAQRENASPPVFLSVNEGLVISALGTAARTFNSKLLDGSWAVLKRSLRQKKAPSPECYLAKIHAHANLGNLPKAFSTLHEFEMAHGNSDHENGQDLFSPFYSLSPLVMACTKNGFTTLDSVYYQLENLSRGNPPYKSVAAINCVILGCANIWDVDRAYQTFTAIDSTYGLIPDVHSYNSLICAFGKLGKRDEAVKVFDHFVGIGLKPDLTTYSLLVDAHLVTRDLKSALSVIDEMAVAGYEPSKEMLNKILRRSVREMDDESGQRVRALARDFKIRIGRKNQSNMLFNLEYSADYA